MPAKKQLGPLTDQEVQTRMSVLVGIITAEAHKEVNQLTAQSNEDIDEMKKTLVSEPKQIIDEWVEKLRFYTERQTKIHCARLRRIAKLRILEAYGDIRESIKNEARERIKVKMSKRSNESDRILGEMLFQGLLRLMESKVLVHTTKADLERVSHYYDVSKKRYKEMTGGDLLLITSRHPLKDHYFGRVVISDKLSTVFVDMNLFTSVDKVADEVFSHYATYQDKVGTSKNWGMEALKQRGLQIMPRGKTISLLQLDSIISTIRGDPRTQAPVFYIREEAKKGDQVRDSQDSTGKRGSISSTHKHRRISSNAGKTRKVTIAPEAMMKPSLSLMEPGGYTPSKYGYRQDHDSVDHIVGPSNDLYNLDYSSATDILSQQTSRGNISDPSIQRFMFKSLSADKEAPHSPPKMQQRDIKRSMSESVDSRFSDDSGRHSVDGGLPEPPPPSEDFEQSRPQSTAAPNASPPDENKDGKKKKTK